MTISIKKTWLAAALVATMAAPAAQAYPLAESGYSNTRAGKSTVAGHGPQVQSLSSTIARGARERAAERSAAHAVSAESSNTRVFETTVAAGHKPEAQSPSPTIDRGARERAAEQSAADAVSTASPSVASVSSEGFNLRDAGIGAAVTAGALMLGGALALALMARIRRRAVHA